jgi:hypothetical protein
MSLTYLGSATGRRIGELEIALRIVQQAETLCLELGNKDGLQRSYGNQAVILRAWGRLEEAMALHKKQEALCLKLGNKNGLQRSERNALSYAFIGGWRVLRPEPRVECKCKEFGRK